MTAADWWRDTHEALAAKIEAGEPLTLRDRKRAAAAVRRSAANPPGPPRRGPGKPPTLPREEARMFVKLLREKPPEGKGINLTRDKAIEYVAKVYGVAFDTVEDAVGPPRQRRKRKT